MHFSLILLPKNVLPVKQDALHVLQELNVLLIRVQVLIIYLLQLQQLIVFQKPLCHQIVKQKVQLLMYVVPVKPDIIKTPAILAQLVDLDVVHAHLLIHAQHA